jgi:ribosomal-protein-alanine N-acetyltransferase
MNGTIRRYREEDFAAVCAIERENSAGDCKPEVFVRQASVLFSETFLVAEAEGRPIGYTIGALVQHRPATGWIIRLAVAGTHRRRGVGDRLVAAVIDALRDRGAEEVCLSVSPSNHTARPLYEKWGFQETGFFQAYFGEGSDRYILRKGISDMKV